MPVLEMLEKTTNEFETDYVLLLWASIIIYMPFDIAGFDAGMQVDSIGSESTRKTIVQRCEI